MLNSLPRGEYQKRRVQNIFLTARIEEQERRQLREQGGFMKKISVCFICLARHQPKQKYNGHIHNPKACQNCGRNNVEIYITNQEVKDLRRAIKGYKNQRYTEVTDAKRRMVFERDNWRCLICNEKDVKKLTVDHIIRQADGGTNELDNLRCLCNDCNSQRHKEEDRAFEASRHKFSDWPEIEIKN